MLKLLSWDFVNFVWGDNVEDCNRFAILSTPISPPFISLSFDDAGCGGDPADGWPCLIRFIPSSALSPPPPASPGDELNLIIDPLSSRGRCPNPMLSLFVPP